MNNFFDTDLIPSENDTHLIRFKKMKGHEHLVKPHLCMAVVGSAGCGKSSFVWSMLSKWYRAYYDIIIIYTGTSDSNEAFEKLGTKLKHDKELGAKKPPKVIIKNEFDEYELNELYLKTQEINNKLRAEGKQLINTLIVFDDFIGKGVLQSSSILKHLVYNRRHCGVSIIFTSQRFRALPQDYRNTNINALVICSVNKIDLQNIAEEYTTQDTSPDDILRMYKRCKEKGKYNPFIIDLTKIDDKERFKCGWTTSAKDI